jgi:predicted kinase
MPDALILCGVPTSGKSTFVNNNPGYTVISSDNIIENYAKLKNKTYNEIFHDYIDTAIELMLGELKQATLNNKNIICDQTHLTSKVRKRKLRFIPKHYKKLAIYFEISREEMFSRNLNKDRTKIVPDHVLSSMHGSYTRPCISEGFSEVHNGQFFSCPLY